jgi:outer membrane protein TolC
MQNPNLKLKTAVKITLALSGAIVFVCGCGLEDSHQQHFAKERFSQIAPMPLPEGKHLDTFDQTPEAPLFADPNDEQVVLSLEQCRAMALQNNLGLKAILIGPKISQAAVQAEEAKFEAAFTSNINYTKTDSPTASRLSSSQDETARTNLGVQMPLQTGGTLQFSVADTWGKSNNEFSLLNPYYTSGFITSISQPLLRNAGRRTSLHSIRVARYNKQMVDARTKLEVIRVLAEVERYYWRLYAARKVLTVRQQQYTLAQAQLERARRFVDAGTHAPIEILRAEAGLATQLEAIILAENDLRNRQRELKQVLQQQDFLPDSPMRIRPDTEPDPFYYELDKTTLITLAQTNRMELLDYELQLARQVSTIDYLRNQALPVVNLDYTYNISGLGATRSDSFDMLGDNRFADHRLGVQLVVPLGNAAAKNRLLGAFYERAQILANTESRRSLIELEVLNAIDRLEANWQRILAGRQNTLLQSQLYEAELRQFEIGLRTSTDVLEAQTRLAEAQRAEIAALTEYQIALVDAAFATGTLLGAAKIEFEAL